MLMMMVIGVFDIVVVAAASASASASDDDDICQQFKCVKREMINHSMYDCCMVYSFALVRKSSLARVKFLAFKTYLRNWQMHFKTVQMTNFLAFLKGHY